MTINTPVIGGRGTTVSPDAGILMPAGVVAGDLLLIFGLTKLGPTTQPSISGWTSLGFYSHGTTASVDDEGSMRAFVWSRLAQTGDASSFVSWPWGVTPAAGLHFAINVSKTSSTTTWDVGLTGAARTASDTAWSVTYPSNPGMTVDDLLIVANAVPTDLSTDSTVGVLTATGLTPGSGTELLAHQTNTAGTDSAIWVDYFKPTAGTASAAPTYTSTLTGGTNLYGISALVRVREVVPSDSTSSTVDVPVDVSGTARQTQNVSGTVDVPVDLTASGRLLVPIVGSADVEISPSGILSLPTPDSIDATLDVEVDLSGVLTVSSPQTYGNGYGGGYGPLAPVPAYRPRGGTATITVTAPPVEDPVLVAELQQTNITMPLPVLSPTGQVDPNVFVPTVTTSPFGRIQILMGGVDVTVLRGVPTEVVSYSSGEPFGDMAAVLRFPGISPFEGAGALSLTGLTMFAGNPDITLHRVLPDGTVDLTAQPLWQGLLASDDDSVNDQNFDGLTVTCMGALFQASLQPHEPSFELNARDIGTVIAEEFNGTLGRRFATMSPVVTGIPTRNRGSWTPRTDFVQELLAEAVTDSGEQWTVQLDRGRKPVLRLKDMDTFHHTMTTGTPGLKIDMTRDRTQATNAVYGEGINSNQCRWRNTRYPKNGKAFFRPLAELSSTQPYLYDTDGTITGPNPEFDPVVIRVARWEQFGTDIEPGQGVTSAQGEISRANQVDFSVTLTLRVDPEEGSRFEIRAGQNLVLKQYRGANRVLHISKVDVQVQSQTVTLTVDSQARDLATLAQIRRRNRDATDPARALVGRRTQSRTQQDQRAVWDCEAGAGTIPPTTLVSGWNVLEVPAGQAGSIVRTLLSTSPAVRFSVAIFGRPVSPSTMNRLAPTPLAEDGEGGSVYDSNADDLDEAGYLIGFGGPGNACGYYPGTDPDSGSTGAHTLTGRLLDDGGWEYSTLYPPTIWVAVWATSGTTISGRLYQSVNGG